MRALSDYIVNFSFGKAINFHSPEATEAIVPSLLKEVWESHNNKERLLLEIGQIGGVSGDVFVKVAYEEPYVDAAGRMIQGKVRILPLNPAFASPSSILTTARLIRFKLKYVLGHSHGRHSSGDDLRRAERPRT